VRTINIDRPTDTASSSATAKGRKEGYKHQFVSARAAEAAAAFLPLVYDSALLMLWYERGQTNTN
jgi:hypothetical protein